MTPTLAGALLAALLIGTTGCIGQGDYFVKTTSADGVEMEVPANKESVAVFDDAIRVDRFQFNPRLEDDPKGVAYTFSLEFRGGARPVAITVDDDSEEPILTILTDDSPKLVRGNFWVAFTKTYNPADEHVKWLLTLDSGVRVYRFTVKLADGSTHVLRYPIFVSNYAKMAARDALGIK
jgi:hypothetical protein